MQCILLSTLIPTSCMPADPLLRAEPATQERKSKKQRLSSAICIVVRARFHKGLPATGCPHEQGHSRPAAENYIAVSPQLFQLWWRIFPQPASCPRTHTHCPSYPRGWQRRGLLLTPWPPSPHLGFSFSVNGWHLLLTTMICPCPEPSDTAEKFACDSFKSCG